MKRQGNRWREEKDRARWRDEEKEIEIRGWRDGGMRQQMERRGERWREEE